MRQRSVMTHGKTAIGKPGRMNTTGSQATGVLVRNPPYVEQFCTLQQEDRRDEPAAINLLYVGSRSRPQRRCDVKRLVILVKGAARRASKDQLRRIESGATSAPGKVPTRLLNFSSTCRLVN